VLDDLLGEVDVEIGPIKMTSPRLFDLQDGSNGYILDGRNSSLSRASSPTPCAEICVTSTPGPETPYHSPSWPGLARPSTICDSRPMRGGWVYILTNKPNGILYTGVTRDIARRIWQHREGMPSGFVRRYDLKRLVYCEYHDTIGVAIQRERNMKHWPRAWKVRLILAMNPDWDDLFETINQ
jgi:putative endonuclease